jgi:hypothetical protein
MDISEISLFYWGEHLNWKPIVWLALATVPLLTLRLLTVLFYLRRLRKAFGGIPSKHDEAALAKAQVLFSSQEPVVPVTVSSLYFLVGLLFIGITLWGLISTAWWMVFLGVFIWYIVHLPFREVMLSWAQFQNVWTIKRDADALLKGDISPEQAEILKKRLEK